MWLLWPLAALLILAGCATEQVAHVEPPPVAPVVVTDNFCASARKRAWSVKDTPESIREAVAWNRAVDKRCGTAK